MNYAIILAAGKGKRMNNKVNKILLTLNNKSIISHAIKPFEDSPLVDKILVIANEDDVVDINLALKGTKKVEKIIEGGTERQDSVYNGLKFLEGAKPDDILIIHNAANPFISQELVEKTIAKAKEYGAAAVAIKAKDTINI